MKVKVCGITQIEQFKELDHLAVDYAGFIFYAPSKRYVGDSKFNQAELLRGSTHAKAVGVFVDPAMDAIVVAGDQLPNMKWIQLHGNEDAMFCKTLQKKYSVIKAIPVSNATDILKEVTKYKNCCDYFLFDTATELHGGSGVKFDWSMLKNTVIPRPFFLSGGIGMEDIKAIKDFRHPAFYGVDVNSKFEKSPGIKDMLMVENFVKQIKPVV